MHSLVEGPGQGQGGINVKKINRLLLICGTHSEQSTTILFNEGVEKDINKQQMISCKEGVDIDSGNRYMLGVYHRRRSVFENEGGNAWLDVMSNDVERTSNGCEGRAPKGTFLDISAIHSLIQPIRFFFFEYKKLA